MTTVDIGTDPANPKIVANLPLMNSVFGPPTNLAITPNGQLALVANSMDQVADGPNWKPSPDNKIYVIDLTTNPPARIDTVVVGKQPSGVAISPTRRLAIAVLLRGSNNATTDWFYNRDGSVVVLRIEGKKVTKVGEVLVRGLPEGAVFSPDGKWLYIGNFMDSDVSVLRVEGDSVRNTGTLLKLPGKPASMRGRTQ